MTSTPDVLEIRRCRSSPSRQVLGWVRALTALAVLIASGLAEETLLDRWFLDRASVWISPGFLALGLAGLLCLTSSNTTERSSPGTGSLSTRARALCLAAHIGITCVSFFVQLSLVRTLDVHRLRFETPTPTLLALLAASLTAKYVLLGPILEELCFRRIWITELSHSMRPVFAAALSTTVFVLLHLDGTAVTTSSASHLANGTVHAVLYWRFKSIWPPVLAHALWNAGVLAWSAFR